MYILFFDFYIKQEYLQTMKCTWKSTAETLKIFKSIQHTNTMVNISFSDNGLYIMSMDTSKTSLVRLILVPEFFESYECSSPLVFGIYTETLMNVLQNAKHTVMTWKATNDLILTLEFTDKDFKTEFALRTIQIDDEQLDIPEMEDDVAFNVQSPVVKDWIDKVLMTKGDVSFDITKTHFVCSSESTELGEIKHTEPIGGERIQLKTHRQDVSIALSFNSTRSFAAFAACGGDACFVGFSNTQPSRIVVPLEHSSSLCLYVAPKIIEED